MKMILTFKILSELSAFLVLFFGVKQKTIDDQNQVNLFGKIILLSGLLLFVFSVSFNYIEYKSKKETNNKNMLYRKKQNELLKESRDSIASLNSQIDKLEKKSDSIRIATNVINNKLKSEFDPILTQRLNFEDGEIIYVAGILKKGMTLKILRGNCQSNLVLLHNNDRIQLHNSGDSWKTVLTEDGEPNKSMIVNESKLQCSVDIEVYSNYDEEINKKIKFYEIDTVNLNSTENQVCDFDDFIPEEGSWTLVQSFSTCKRKYKKIDWPDLVLYYNITSFKKVGSKFLLKGYKIGEAYKGKKLHYSKRFSLGAEEGNLQNCVITIPINDETKTKNGIENNWGYFKFKQIQVNNEKTILSGDFFHSGHECQGKLKLIK